MKIKLLRKIPRPLPTQYMRAGSEREVIRTVAGHRQLKGITMFYVVMDDTGREVAIRPDECEVVEG